MRVSFNWLKKYVTLPASVTPQEIADKLKAATVEVEGIVSPGEHLKDIVVGLIKKVEKHPNADKLKVCQVNLENEEVVIVCGGSNVAEGMLVAVAKLGASVRWHGQGEPVVMEKATIRGVDSFGMICASDEIGLSERFPKKDEREIVDLTPLKVKPGTALSEALGLSDALLEIDNKSLSNRPDLWGHYGLAREVAVLCNREVSKYETVKIKSGKGVTLKVDIAAKEDCVRYMAVAIQGVAVSESPVWLKEALLAVGVRPVNCIVDAANYVMLDSGQPLHAFDARHVDAEAKNQNTKHIIVRKALEGERITTLDGVERMLDENMLVIADSKTPIALAGIMGGKESGITTATTDIIIESANFQAATIRSASTKLNLRTDASMRFEKSLDPNVCGAALERVVALIIELCPGAAVASAIIDKTQKVRKSQTLEIPLSFFEQKIGVTIPEKTIEQILTRLGFGVKSKKGQLAVSIPTWRGGKDVTIAEDIVEEVLRIFGYDAVPARLPLFEIAAPTPNDLRALERQTAEMVAREVAFTEVYNYSFVSRRQIVDLGGATEKYLELDNPISKEKPYIRRHLLPNLLEAAVAAQVRSDRVSLFEIGTVFHSEEVGLRTSPKSDNLLPRQDTWLTAIYSEKKNPAPFWEAKRVAEVFFSKQNLPVEYAPRGAAPLEPYQHPTRTTWLKVDDEIVGEVYELHPEVAEKYGLLERVGVCSVNLSALIEKKAVSLTKVYRTIPEYPEVVRDLAFLAPKNLTHQEVVRTISLADELVKSVTLFDAYSGKSIPEDRKSLAYHITFANPDRTLTSAEVETVFTKIVDLMKKKYSIEVR
jgi:phenylalanyl-tRNA synthetase beta chain